MEDLFSGGNKSTERRRKMCREKKNRVQKNAKCGSQAGTDYIGNI